MEFNYYSIKLLQSLFLLLLISCYSTELNAQRITETGFTGGGIRFYPEAQPSFSSLNNSMDNGGGWSAGVYFEDHWRRKIHQVIEINYYNLSSDVYMQKNSFGPGGYDGEQPVYGNFDNTAFNLIAVSGGIKYFLTRNLFVYPAFEFARSLNQNIDSNKTTYHLKAGAGVTLYGIDVALEYAYGIKYQRMLYDPSVPFAGTHRNKYLQLKFQVPLYKFK